MAKEVKFHTAYSPRIRSQTFVEGESLTHQSFRDEADVNFIIDRYTKTGFLNLKPSEGFYMDVSGFGDFDTHMNNLKAVEAAFYALSEEDRALFDSPADFLAATADPERMQQLLEEDVPEGGSEQGSEATGEASGQGLEEAASDPPAQ